MQRAKKLKKEETLTFLEKITQFLAAEKVSKIKKLSTNQPKRSYLEDKFLNSRRIKIKKFVL